MNLINKLTKAVEEIKQTAESTFDNERVKIVSISKLKFDEDFKGLFEQEPEKVERITENMKQNGFDKSQPIIVTPDWKILDGNSRYLAAKKANIEYVPVVVKVFNSKEDAINYELHLQTIRRNLTDFQIFSAFLKYQEIKTKEKINGNSKTELTDEKIAELLNKSPRHISKMREISVKATPALLEKIKDGTYSINQAYNKIKANEKKEVITPILETEEQPLAVAHYNADNFSEKAEFEDTEETTAKTIPLKFSNSRLSTTEQKHKEKRKLTNNKSISEFFLEGIQFAILKTSEGLTPKEIISVFQIKDTEKYNFTDEEKQKIETLLA